MKSREEEKMGEKEKEKDRGRIRGEEGDYK